MASFNEKNLIDMRYIFEIDLIIAGQYSPLIVSQNKLNFEDARNTSLLNGFLIKESLNKLIVNDYKTDNLSSRDLINTNLGRVV